MYRAVIFDFDGTIIDTEQHLFNVINKHLEMHNADPISIDFYRSSIGGAATDLHDRLVRKIKINFMKNIILLVQHYR